MRPAGGRSLAGGRRTLRLNDPTRRQPVLLPAQHCVQLLLLACQLLTLLPAHTVLIGQSSTTHVTDFFY